MPRPAPANRTDFKFLSSLPTRWMDNDQYGHMNNVVHYSLFDTAVSNWQMAQGGFNVTGEVTKLMVVESGCRYFDEAGYPDLLRKRPLIAGALVLPETIDLLLAARRNHLHAWLQCIST